MLYYYCRKENHFYLEIGKFLEPLFEEIKTNGLQSSNKAVALMHGIISEIPLNIFKDAKYTKQVISAIEIYLKHSDNQGIKIIARKQKTDRLEIMTVIACDCLEYFAFLPMQLEAATFDTQEYLEALDNMFWLLRKNPPHRNYVEILKQQLSLL